MTLHENSANGISEQYLGTGAASVSVDDVSISRTYQIYLNYTAYGETIVTSPVNYINVVCASDSFVISENISSTNEITGDYLEF